MIRRRAVVTYICVAASMGLAQSTCADDFLSIYSGTTQTHPSNVRAIVPLTNTDLTFNHVDWSTNATEQPYYFGARYTHYFDEWPAFGFAVDFTHNKMFSNLAGAYSVSGFRGGVPVTAVERLSSSFEELQMTHGFNTLTVGPMFRLNLCEDECGTSWIQPYFGVGVGLTRPHVEVQMVGLPDTDDYRWGGLAYQAQAGINVRLTSCLSIFAEFKVVCAPTVDVDIYGGTLRTRAVSHHFIIGPAFTW
jgi:lipid A oxidase